MVEFSICHQQNYFITRISFYAYTMLIFCFMWAHVSWLLLLWLTHIVSSPSFVSVHLHTVSGVIPFFFFFSCFIFTFKLTGTKTCIPFPCQNHLSLLLSQSMDQLLQTSQNPGNTICLPAKLVEVWMCEELFYFNSIRGIKDLKITDFL